MFRGNNLRRRASTSGMYTSGVHAYKVLQNLEQQLFANHPSGKFSSQGARRARRLPTLASTESSRSEIR